MGVQVAEVGVHALVVEHAGVSQEEIEDARTLGELEGVPALVREERAHIDGKVLLVGQWRGQGEGQTIVVGLLVHLGRMKN